MKHIAFKFIVIQKYIYLFIGLLCGINAFAYDFSYPYMGQTLHFNILSENDKTCETTTPTITNLGGNLSGSLKIPKTVVYEGVEYTVISIGEYSFNGCEGLTSVTLPNTITSIKEMAFGSCTGLTSIVIPISVTSIRDGAFIYCENLTSVYTEDLISWCNIEFGERSNPLWNGADLYVNGKILNDLNLPEGIKVIHDYTFDHCRSLINVEFPTTLIYIGDAAFNSCSGLSNINFSKCKSLKSIGVGAFGYCRSLTSINMTNCESLLTMGNSVFMFCSGLQSIDFTGCNNLINIDEYAFAACNRIQEIKIKNIEDWLKIKFGSLASNPIYVGKKNNPQLIIGGKCLEHLEVPDSVTTIHKYAFASYKKLKSVKFSSALTYIADYSFYNCDITRLDFENCVNLNNIGSNAFSGSEYGNAAKIVELDLTSCFKLQTIESCAFSNCKDLKLVVLPSNLKKLGEKSFASDTDLRYVVCNATEPPMCETGVFSGSQLIRDGILYVPEDHLQSYKYSTEWKDVKNIAPLDNFVEANSIFFKETSIDLVEGDKCKLEFYPYPENSYIVCDAYWESLNTDIASVDNSGKVTAVAPGETQIRVRYGQYTAECKIIVGVRCRKLRLNQNLVNLNLGDSINLSIREIVPAGVDMKRVTWESSNSNIASVDSNGLVKAISVGTVDIKAKCGDGYDICQVIVNIPIYSIDLDKQSVELSIDESITLIPTIYPYDATDKSLNWTTQAPEVATVDEEGNVMAIGEGETIIRVSAASNPEVYAECHVTVNGPVVAPEIIWDQEFRCAVGESVELTGYSSDGNHILYESIVPDGGFQQADIYEDDGRIIVSFPTEGAYILSAKTADKSVEKCFNVVPTHDGLMQIDGIYYRFTDDQRSSLKVVRGYDMYCGDYVIPSKANGIPVTSIDDKAFYSCMELNDVVVQEGIMSFGRESFGNSRLHSISIPSTVKSLAHNYIFNVLRGNLQSISLHGNIPPEADDATFNGFVNYDECVVHIPEGSYSLYRESPIWENFKYIIDDLPGIINNEKVIISQEEWMPIVGDEIDLSATVLPDDATDRTLTWSSSDSNIVSVDGDGHAVAVAAGEAWIRVCVASYPEIYAECHVMVSPNVITVEKVILSHEEWLAKTGEEIDLVANVLPEDATDKTLTWSSSDSDIVSVDRDGHAVAVAAGEAWIRVCVASYPEIYAECHVMVSPNVITVEKVILSHEEWLAKTGDEIDLVANVLPEDATDKTLTWSSSNSDIVSVDGDGHAVAVAAGEALICVCVASNPEIYAECHVTVNEPVVDPEIIWDQEFRCAVGESVELTGYSSDGSPILYESIVPNGGFLQADINEEDSKFIVSFPAEGAYILTAKTADKSVEKRFNVVPTHEGLMQIGGIYYRFTDDQGLSLKVVRGYDMYCGDYVIPAKANGIPVKSIDDWAFYSCMELNDVEVREGIMSFGQESFGNSTLHSVSIPSTVKSLAHDYIFNALRGTLQSISIHGNIPPEADESTFNGFVNYDECVVHIPEGSYPLYSSAPIWKNFKYIIDDLPRIINIEKVTLSKEAWLPNIGDEVDLVATVLPDDATDKALTWSSSDSDIVSVDENGHAKAVAAGEAWIRVCAAGNPEISAECHAVVSPRMIVVEKVIISQEEWMPIVGDEIDLSATVLPDDATDKALTWSSSDSNIVSVDENGHAKAVTAGEAYIRVCAAGNPEIYAECHAVVSPRMIAVEKIVISQNEWMPIVGDEIDLSATVLPVDATDKALTWSSSDSNIVSVDENGHAKAVTAGEACIRVCAAGNSEIYAECHAVVSPRMIAVEKILISQNEWMPIAGEEIDLVATVLPEDATDKALTWSSSDSNIVSVDENGHASAVAAGEAWIHVCAADNPEISAECHAVVSPRMIVVEKVIISQEKWMPIVGDEIDLSATVLPDDATDKALTWSSSDSDIVSVDENGHAKAVAAGEAWIRVCAADNPEISAECHAVVSPRMIAVEKILISQNEWMPIAGEEIDLVATVLPEDATDKALTWSSSDSNIVSVDENGHASAVAAGEAWIRVCTADNPKISAECHAVVSPKAIAVEKVVISHEEWLAKTDEEIDLVANVLPEDATDKTLTWSSSDSDIVSVDGNGHAVAVAAGEALIRVCVASNPEIYAECHVTVNEPVVAPEIIWDQEFRCAVGESVELTGYSSDGSPILYESIVPNGGFQHVNIYEEDGRFIASFPTEGAYILTAKVADKSVEKRFNVVPTHEGLMQIDGIYYRFTDNQGSSLKVVRGYDMYCGDYDIPSKANGIPVTSIDNWAFYSCMELNDVEVQEGIMSFGRESFGNSTLYSISIPSTVKSLAHDYVFNALRGTLQSISIHGNIPPEADETTFNGYVDYEKCVVHIPEGTYPLYSTAPIWKKFKQLVDDLPNDDIGISIRIYGGDRTILVGEFLELKALVLPTEYAEDVSWESSDPGIVSVDNTGVITGVSPGVATIYAKVGECYETIKVNVEFHNGTQIIKGNDKLKLSINGMDVVLQGLPEESVISIIRTDGVIIRKIIATSTEMRISIDRRGIYLIRVNDRMYKIMI